MEEEEEAKKQRWYVDSMMNTALELANKAFDEGEVPVGCVFSKWDCEKEEFTILSTGHNLTKLKKNVKKINHHHHR